MKQILALVCGCLLSTTVWAQNPSYEASSGLIFVGALMVFYDSKGPLSYQTSTPRDLPKNTIFLGEVVGDSCQYGISIPIIFSLTDRISVSGGKGDGSYKKALLDLHRRHPEVEGIYDVKVDKHKFSVLLGIFQRNCTRVVAQGFRRSRLKEGPGLSSE